MGVTLKKLTKKPGLYAIYALGRVIRGNDLLDECYLNILFRYRVHKKLNLKNPIGMDQKLQWLKIHNKNPKYTEMVDKYWVRSYIQKKIGNEYLVPLLGVWERFDDINFDSLPDQFVLKCTHDSGGLVICRDKIKLNMDDTKKKIKTSLKRNYYLNTREWPYKNVKPRIIAEEYISDTEGGDYLTDYKFYCFNGVVDAVMLCIDREKGNPKFYFFDKEWNLKRYNKRGKEAPEGFTLPKPPKMKEMFEIAEKLSRGIPFVRIDLYNVKGKIYFGEFTFYPQSGFEPNRLPEVDRHFGDLIDLELIKGGKY